MFTLAFFIFLSEAQYTVVTVIISDDTKEENVLFCQNCPYNWGEKKKSVIWEKGNSYFRGEGRTGLLRWAQEAMERRG